MYCGTEETNVSKSRFLRAESGSSFKPQNHKICQYKSQQGMCHTVALPFTFSSILMQMKNYGNSNISPCQNIMFKTSSRRKQNLSRYL
jgi:hypothetical protein